MSKIIAHCTALIVIAITYTKIEQRFMTVAASEWIKIEKPCLCQEFRCNNGVFCLHASKVCNGVPDCIGGEEEKGYNGTGKCVRQRPNCRQNEFKCKFGDCIKLEQVCDGKIDCWGGVDEAIDFCSWVYGNDTEITPKQMSPTAI